MKLKHGICNKCGAFVKESAGCSHASCGGLFIADRMTINQHLLAAQVETVHADDLVTRAGEPDAENWFEVRVIRARAQFHRDIVDHIRSSHV